jgi:hypothetical protein
MSALVLFGNVDPKDPSCDNHNKFIEAWNIAAAV